MLQTTAVYDNLNNAEVKYPSYVLTIAGYPIILGTCEAFTYIRYGDKGIKYGKGWIYGGTRPIANQRALIELGASTSSIMQTHEQEQGRASIAALTLSIVDENGDITRLVSPGIIIDDALGADVEFFGGFQEGSFPEDYVKLFRGYIQGITIEAGRVKLDLVDPSGRRKQECFISAKTKLAGAVNTTQTSIDVVNAADLHAVTSGLSVGVKIGDELITYTGISGNTLTGCTRGALSIYGGKSASDHAAGDDVSAFVMVEELAIDIALRLMLSNKNDYWKTGVKVRSIVNTNGTPRYVPDSLTFFDDIKSTWGLVAGDIVLVDGYVTPFTIESIDGKTLVVIEKGILVQEGISTKTASFKSKYDVWPNTMGLRLTPSDVDVERFEYWRDTFLGSQVMGFLIDETESSGKEFIEKELLLPVCAYSLVRSGRISMGLTHPPLTTETLTIMDDDAVVDPATSNTVRGFNNRRFFNDVVYEYDYKAGEYKASTRRVDSESLNRFKGYTKTLPIQSRGFRTHLGADALTLNRTYRFLQRYKFGCEEINITSRWGNGHLIEVGDIVVLNDKGALQLPNTDDGTREIRNRPMEVLDRNVGIKDGKVKLKLLSRAGFELTDRYAVLSPSSNIIRYGADWIEVTASFGSKYGVSEHKKWTPVLGMHVRIFSPDYSRDNTVIITRQDTANLNRFYLSAMPPVAAGDIMTLAKYDDTDKNTDTLAKNVYAFFNPTGRVAYGTTQFVMDDVTYVYVGAIIYVRNGVYTLQSVEATVTDVTGNTVTVNRSLGFTPSSGHYVELIGYHDGGKSYRII
jgi:hypothetical protein